MQAWASWCQKKKELLENVQKREVKSDSYEQRLKELQLTSLEGRRQWADMALVHNVMHGRTETEVKEWFTRAVTGNRATRAATGALNVLQKHRRLETRKKLFHG